MWVKESGTKKPEMINEKVEMMVIEITADKETMFRTGDVEVAKAFLSALGEKRVRIVMSDTAVQTDADIALLILERKAA